MSQAPQPWPNVPENDELMIATIQQALKHRQDSLVNGEDAALAEDLELASLWFQHRAIPAVGIVRQVLPAPPGSVGAMKGKPHPTDDWRSPPQSQG